MQTGFDACFPLTYRLSRERDPLMEDHVVYLQSCMYQYSRAIYRSIKDLIDPYTDQQTQLESRRTVLEECELTMSRLAADPQYFAASRSRPLPGHPPLLPDHRAGAGRVGGARGRRSRDRVHRAADRGRSLRRRDRPLQGDDAQGQGVPAHAAPEPRLLPVAPAPPGSYVARRVRERRRSRFLLVRGSASDPGFTAADPRTAGEAEASPHR